MATDPTALIARKIKELPPLPLVVAKLVQVTDDDRSNARDVQEVLASDQALASKVLKLVNSSFYGMSGEVSTISRAIVILGFAAIRNLATGLGVVGAMARVGGSRQEAFWAHAIGTAAAAQVIAENTGYEDPEEAFIAGLLHDIGHLILASAMPREFAAVMDGGRWNLLEREQKTLGATHNKVGQKVLRHWKLPEKLGHAVRFHHNLKVATNGENPLTPLVALADAVSGVLGAVYEHSYDEEAFTALMSAVGVEPEGLVNLLPVIDAKVEETRLFLKLATDTEHGPRDPVEAPPRRLVLLSTDALKRDWVAGVLRHFGHELVEMKTFFAAVAAGQDPVDLVILDQGGITPQQILKMKPVLLAQRERLVCFGATDRLVTIPGLDLEAPVLPVVFSRHEIEDLVPQPAPV